jgi:hypothetical protein
VGGEFGFDLEAAAFVDAQGRQVRTHERGPITHGGARRSG